MRKENKLYSEKKSTLIDTE